MTEEQVKAGTEALCMAIWNKPYTMLGSNDQKRVAPWVRAVLAAAEGPAPPPVSEVDRIWRHLAEVSST